MTETMLIGVLNGIGLSLAALLVSTHALLLGTTTIFLRSYRPGSEKGEWDSPIQQNTTAPLVTILKPLKGLDQDLEQNLAAFLDLEGPSYEVLFGVADPQDPAVLLVKTLINDYPEAPFRLVITDPVVGFNPKMVNLSGLEPYIQGELVLISDANTRPHRDSLRRLLWAFRDPEVGYGCAPFVVRGSHTTGARLRALHIGTQLVCWICGLYGLTGVAPIMGKWMVFRRQALRDVGGFEELSHYLAADGLTGTLLSRFGWKGVIIPDLIDIVFGTWTVSEAWNQLLRWARLIRFLHPLGPLNLLVWNGLCWCLLGTLLACFGAGVGGMALVGLGLWCWMINSVPYVQRGGDPSDLSLLPVLDLQQICAVIASYGDNTIRWRDREFKVGWQSRIVDHPVPTPSQESKPH